MHDPGGVPRSPTQHSCLHIETQIITGNARAHVGPHINQSITNTNEERIAVLNWLSPLKSAETHNRIREQTPIQNSETISSSGDCTGKWLLDSDVFDDWRSRRLSHLWYHGMPGAGKTVLASVIIEHMRHLGANLKPSPDVGKVAFLYLQYGNRHPVHHLVGSIVRQLVEDDARLPEVVLQQYKTHAQKGETSATETLLSSILCDLASQRPVYIVLDALDEYWTSSKEAEDDSNCKRLLKHLVPDGAQEGSISILITSRLLDEFTDLSQNFHRVNIGANERDISIFVDHEFDTKIRLQKFAKIDTGIRDLVKETLARSCGGMFLLARLHMSALANQLTMKNFQEQLYTLPKDIDGTYDAIVERLRQLPTEAKQNLAWNTLGWIVLGKRHLRTGELQHALACTTGAETLDPREFYDLDDVQELCGGLITYTNNTVTLVHYTAQSYFESRAQKLFGNFHDTIAQACLRYLHFFSLSCTPHGGIAVTVATSEYNQHSSYIDQQQGIEIIPSTSPLSYVLTWFPFVEYAISFLTYHLDRQNSHQSHLVALNLISKLLDDKRKRYFLCHMLRKLDLYPSRVLPLRYHELWRSVLESAQEGGEEEKKTGSAAEEDSPFRYLLGKTGSVSSTSSLPRNAIGKYESSSEDVHSEVHDLDSESAEENKDFHRKAGRRPITAKSIIRQNRRSSRFRRPSNELDTDLPEDNEETSDEEKLIPRFSETSNSGSGYSWDIQNRLKYRTESFEEDWSEASSLHIAVCIGWNPLVRQIAQSVEDINAVDSRGLSPLCVATQKANFKAVEIILSHGDAFVDLSTAEGHAILLHLAQNGRSDLIDCILSEVLSPLLFSNVPFLVQALSFIIAKVLLLLCGIRINWRLWTPHPVKHQPHCALSDLQLLDAAHRGHFSVIKRLIEEKRIDLEYKTAFASTAVFLAVAFHRTDIVEYLLDHGIDPNIRGPRGIRLLHLATRSNDVAMVELLLAKKADATATDDDGLPAWLASFNMAESQQLMSMFVKAGVDLNVIEPNGGPKLYWASCAGDINLVQFLLKNGADPSRRTLYDWAPLHYAAHNGRLDCVLALLDAKAELSPISDQSKTPLDMAIQGKQRYIAKLLKERGAKTAQELYAERGSNFSRYNSRLNRARACFRAPMGKSDSASDGDYASDSDEYELTITSSS